MGKWEELTLKEKAQLHLKDEIAQDEYDIAEPQARKKLDYINKRYGTSHGEDYLAILIAETVKSNRFHDYTVARCDEILRRNNLTVNIG